MAMSLNKVMLIGYTGQDPEIRYSPSGTCVANFSVATTEKRKDQNGDYQEQTEWHRIVAFGKTAEFAQDYLHKGARIYIEGRIQTSSWTDRDGVDRKSTQIVTDRLISLSSNDGAGTGTERQQPAQRQGQQPRDNQDTQDDDLPF